MYTYIMDIKEMVMDIIDASEHDKSFTNSSKSSEFDVNAPDLTSNGGTGMPLKRKKSSKMANKFAAENCANKINNNGPFLQIPKKRYSAMLEVVNHFGSESRLGGSKRR